MSETLPGLVFPYCATGDHVATKGTNVGDDIASTSSMQALTGDAYHWHWCFRGNALYLSPDIPVKHQVTKDQYTDLSKTFEPGR